mgnify:FL=1
MYANFPHDINPPASIVDEGLSFDDWLDTPEGWAWLDNMSDTAEMSHAAQFGDRPALATTWEGF